MSCDSKEKQLEKEKEVVHSLPPPPSYQDLNPPLNDLTLEETTFIMNIYDPAVVQKINHLKFKIRDNFLNSNTLKYLEVYDSKSIHGILEKTVMGEFVVDDKYHLATTCAVLWHGSCSVILCLPSEAEFGDEVQEPKKKRRKCDAVLQQRYLKFFQLLTFTNRKTAAKYKFTVIVEVCFFYKE
jgi:hypothetical protein